MTSGLPIVVGGKDQANKYRRAQSLRWTSLLTLKLIFGTEPVLINQHRTDPVLVNQHRTDLVIVNLDGAEPVLINLDGSQSGRKRTSASQYGRNTPSDTVDNLKGTTQ
ncbi:Hypothetical predicted protein [Mytilus galloprovincialis]|uniref:Uncharacterized protein n=1 Tax=Mytilus galloprovincialis TaxID=29158 RepID=A0A8B6GD56_MYTGA|nr:Hypothetical predicted protein [Mytilus galloprovincialis]